MCSVTVVSGRRAEFAMLTLCCKSCSCALIAVKRGERGAELEVGDDDTPSTGEGDGLHEGELENRSRSPLDDRRVGDGSGDGPGVTGISGSGDGSMMLIVKRQMSAATATRCMCSKNIAGS